MILSMQISRAGSAADNGGNLSLSARLVIQCNTRNTNNNNNITTLGG